MSLFGTRRKRRCFYCNRDTPLEPQAGPVRQFECHNCLAINHLDQNGDITDPPVQSTSCLPQSPPRYARNVRPRSTSPKSDFTFCAQCQQNHHVLATAKANIDPPDEDSPAYPQYLQELAKLESRYPLICNKCRPLARDRIIDSVYDAKAQNLLEIMNKTKYQTHNTLAQWKRASRGWLLWLGGFGWIVSVLAQFIWHMLGARSSDFESSEIFDDPIHASHGLMSLTNASLFSHFFETGVVDPRVFHMVTTLLPAMLATEILTIWWNPRLRRKFLRNGRGRMAGSRDFYMLQAILLMLRYSGAYFLQRPQTLGLEMDQFKYAHGAVGTVILLLALRSTLMVRLDMRPVVNFQRFNAQDVLPDPGPRVMQQKQHRKQVGLQKQEKPKLRTGMLSDHRATTSYQQPAAAASRWPTAYASHQSIESSVDRAQHSSVRLNQPTQPDEMVIDPSVPSDTSSGDVFHMSSALRGWLPPTPTFPKEPDQGRSHNLRARKPKAAHAPPTYGSQDVRRPSFMDDFEDTTDTQSVATEVIGDQDDDRINVDSNPTTGARFPELQMAPTKLWLDKDFADTGLEDMFASVLGGNSFAEDSDRPPSGPSSAQTQGPHPAAGTRLGSWLSAAALILFPVAILATCAFAVKSLR